MSQRQRVGGSRHPNLLVYEDFQPQTDTNEEEGARVVVLHVPGFLKDQMKITLEHGNNITVQGQRPLLDNRWSRFNMLLPIPQNCDVQKIHAKFHNGLLTITMPKVFQKTTLLSPTAEKTVEKTTRGTISDTLPPEATESKVVPPSVSEPNQEAAAAAELRAQKDQEKALQTAVKDERQKSKRDAPTSVEKIPQKTEEQKVEKSEGEGSEEQKVENRRGETTDTDEKQRDVRKMGQGQKNHMHEIADQREIGGKKRVLDLADQLKASSEPSQPKAQKDDEAISSRQSYEDRKNAHETLKEPEKVEKVEEISSDKVKESTQNGKKSAGTPPAEVAAVSKISDNGKKAAKNLVSGTADENGEATSGKKLGIKYIAEAAKQKMTDVVKKLNDDNRQMLINVGAAVLVLVALGAYVTYSNFRSSAKTQK